MQKKVSFKSSKGYLLKGVLHVPRGKGPFPAVIVQHGFRTNHEKGLIKSIAKKLESCGFVALRFSLSGHGLSGGNYKNILISQFVADIGRAINFLLKQPQVNKLRIGIVGHSMAALSALISANKFSEYIRSIVSIASVYDINELKNNYQKYDMVDEIGKDYWDISGYKITSKHFNDKFYLQKRKVISDIHCPVLLLHGNRDIKVPSRNSREIYNLLEHPKDLVIIKRADHNFNNPRHIQRVVNLTTKWFKKYLAFKVSKVINVFLEHNSKILILKRSQKVGTHRGIWCAVGGYLEEGKPVLQNAKQEVKEELGIRIIGLKDYRIGKSFKFEEKVIDRIWHVHPVLFRLKSKPRIKLDWENTEYKWVKPEEIKKFKTIPMMERDLLSFNLIIK